MLKNILHTKNSVLIIIIFLAVCGAASILFVTRQGIGTSPDAVVYIGAARNFADGKGLTVPFGEVIDSPMTHRPPFYSIVLGTLGVLGLDPLISARWLNAIIFGLLIFSIGFSLQRIPKVSPAVPIIGSLLLLAALPMVMIHSHAWTEPLFIILGLSGFFTLATYFKNSKHIYLLLSALLIGLTALTRYAGIAFVGAGSIAILLLSNRNFITRIAQSVGFGIVSSLPLLFWVIRNLLTTGAATSREFIFHPMSRAHILQTMQTVSAWFLIPSSSSSLIKITLLLVMALGLSVVIILHITPRNRKFKQENSKIPDLIQLLIIFILVYGIFLVASISFFDANIPMDDRLLSPVFVSLLIMSLYFIDWFLQNYRDRTYIKYISVFIAALFSITYFYSSLNWALPNSATGMGFSNQTWQQSEIVAEIDTVPPTSEIYSNSPHAVYFMTGRSAMPLPKPISTINQQENKDYLNQLKMIGDQVQNQASVVIFFDFLAQESGQTEADLLKLSTLDVLVQAADGKIYGRKD